MKIYVGRESVSADLGEPIIYLSPTLHDEQRVFISSASGSVNYVLRVRELRELGRKHGKLRANKFVGKIVTDEMAREHAGTN